jgi:hypothetical protein
VKIKNIGIFNFAVLEMASIIELLAYKRTKNIGKGNVPCSMEEMLP